MYLGVLMWGILEENAKLGVVDVSRVVVDGDVYTGGPLTSLECRAVLGVGFG